MILYITDVAQSPSAVTSIKQINITPYDDISGSPIETYTVLGLTAGTSYVSNLTITTLSGTKQVVYTGSCRAVQVGTTPPRPLISGSGINSGIIITFLPPYGPLVENSISDGFSVIDNLTIFYSDASGNGLQVYDISNTEIIYNEDGVTLTGLTNLVSYEVAVALSNFYGTSGISNTIVAIPDPAPAPVAYVDANETAYLYQDGSTNLTDFSGHSITVSFPSSEVLLTTTPATQYDIWRVDCDASGVEIEDSDKLVGTIEVDLSNNILSCEPGVGVFIDGSFNYIDDSVNLGSLYQYYVISSNDKYVSQPSSDSDVVLSAGLPGSPDLSIDPSNCLLIVTVTPPADLNGGYFDDEYYATLRDASGEVLNVPGEVTAYENVIIFGDSARTTGISNTLAISAQSDFANDLSANGFPGSFTNSRYNAFNSAVYDLSNDLVTFLVAGSRTSSLADKIQKDAANVAYQASILGGPSKTKASALKIGESALASASLVVSSYQ
jgi:hypothetical protein